MTYSGKIMGFRTSHDLNLVLVQVLCFNKICQATPEDKVPAAMGTTHQSGSAGPCLVS